MAWGHAVFATLSGSWYFLSGEHERVRFMEPYGVSTFFNFASVVGFGYFTYDVLWVLVQWRIYLVNIPSIAVHHAIFVVAFLLSQVWLCAGLCQLP